MNIESVTVRGFRCFDDVGEKVSLGDLTCLVGPNASGKTAAMVALGRLFGESQNQRRVVPADFHLAPGEDLRAKQQRELMIECRLAFPELEGDEEQALEAVPETFNQMIVDAPGATPYCRVRLDATWTDDGTPEGDVTQTLSWILTDSEDLAVIDDGNRKRVQPADRAKIRAVYVPAARDPSQQIRTTTATSFGRLLEALAWEGADESMKEKLDALQTQLVALTGIQTMNSEVQDAWKGFYDGRIARDVAFRALDEDPAALVKMLVPTFRPGDNGRILSAGDLSDGLRSLFSLSLSLGLFRVEELLRKEAAPSGFNPEVSEEIPILTLFAVEEPENHLSPHYLGRVVNEFAGVASSGRAQVLVSSHSPAILGRVAPDKVRYFLGNENVSSTRVKDIPLPTDKEDEAFKYVREAVRGYPELYFSRLVILGEGPSEEIVIRRLFEASGTPLDTHFISIVPLGGRHVNHFWRLLHGLEIPFLTLLDLDREKEGAGWGRIQYVRDQLIRLHGAGSSALRTFDESGNETFSLENEHWNAIGNFDVTNAVDMKKWIDFLRNQYQVFFSEPLDLDFSMLAAFQDVYKGLAPHPKGPRLPEPGAEDYESAIDRRMKQVLASDADKAPENLGSTYDHGQKELFAWYKYLFVDGSKPVNHMRALLSIDDAALSADAPESLKSLVTRARQLLASGGGDA